MYLSVEIVEMQHMKCKKEARGVKDEISKDKCTFCHLTNCSALTGKHFQLKKQRIPEYISTIIRSSYFVILIISITILLLYCVDDFDDTKVN